jgi:hypothetical protein
MGRQDHTIQSPMDKAAFKCSDFNFDNYEVQCPYSVKGSCKHMYLQVAHAHYRDRCQQDDLYLDGLLRNNRENIVE